MDRVLLPLSTLIFAVNFSMVFTRTLRGQAPRPMAELALICAGFLMQTWVLWQLGQQHGRCPITSLSEVLVFLSWAVVIWYFLLGPTYRLSLLGKFSSALVALLQTAALLLGIRSAALARPTAPVDPWLELHASLSLLAYGAFAVAGLAGLMFLAHDRQLKKRPPPRVLLHLPPITTLFRAMMLVLVLGCLLLVAGMAAGHLAHGAPTQQKYLVSYLVLAIYAGLVALRWMGTSHRRVALGAVAGFLAAVLSLWIVS